MISISPKLIITGFSGSGKTTLIEQLIPYCTKYGYLPGYIKHTGHIHNFDTNGKEQKIVNTCVTGWKGFKDKHGNNMKFTTKNLTEMMSEDGFTDWVIEEHEKLAVEIEGSEEEVVKNSKS